MSGAVSRFYEDAPAFHSTIAMPYFLADDWFLSAVRSISSFSQLPDNWNSYGSPPITPEARRQALDVALQFSRLRLPEPVLGPVSGGGLQFTWQAGPRELELEVLPDGSIEYLRVYEDDQMREGTIAAGQIGKLRQQVNWLVEEP